MSQLRITGNAIISGAGQSLQLTSASDVYLNVTRGASILNIGIDATGSFYNTSTSHRFFTNSGTINALTITAAGNIGIGTTIPAYKTVIQTANNTSGLLITTNANESETGLYIAPDHTNGIIKLLASGNADKAFAFYTGNTERMRIASGGNVLIGTTTDAGYKLDVNSIGRFFNADQGAARVIIQNTGSGGQAVNLIAGNPNVDQTGFSIAYGNTNFLRFNSTGAATFSALVTNYNVYNTQTASYTLVLADASKIVEMNVGSANTVTVPTNASVGFPIGTEITVMQYGAGVTTIASASGVTINSKSNARIIGNRYTGATLIKKGTDEWYLIGNIVV